MLTANPPLMRPHAANVLRRQRGVFLIEALIAILIFSLGILTLVAIQTSAVSAQSDAQYRIEAANFTDKVLSEIWLNVDRTNAASVQGSLAAFAHNTGGASCSFSGGASASPIVTAWVTEVTGGAGKLPGAGSAMQQILVDTATFNKVTVTVCWKTPKDTTVRKHTVATFIN